MDGFHVKLEAFAILAPENEFYVKPEIFAFDLAIGEPLLRLVITYNGKNIIVPCITSAGKPVLIVRWNGINWYNPLVSPTSYRESTVLTTYKGQTLAFST